MRINKLIWIFFLVTFSNKRYYPLSLEVSEPSMAPALQGRELGQAHHPAQMAPVSGAVAPRAAWAGGVGGGPGLPGAAP